MPWRSGRGVLGPLRPLLGHWITLPGDGLSAAAQMRCSRSFVQLGKGWIELDARWQTGPLKEYRERAFFGPDEGGRLAFFSFTSDCKRSTGHLSDASEIHAEAIVFEAQMPAGMARMVYWPLATGDPGFHFAVESKSKKGWNRFLAQAFGPCEARPNPAR